MNRTANIFFIGNALHTSLPQLRIKVLLEIVNNVTVCDQLD